MAKNTDIQMGNENIRLPEYALEKTSADMLKQMEAVAKNNAELLAAMKDLIKTAEDSAKTGKQGDAAVVAAVTQAKAGGAGGGFRDKFADRIEADFQQVFEGFGKSLGIATKSLAGLAGITVAITASLYSAYSSLSDNIYQLQQVGAGFDSVNGTVMDTISSFNRLGIDTDMAVKMMSEFSRTTAIVGRERMPKLTKQFLDLTNKGRDLGLNLEQASESMLEEVENRSRLMDISGMEESKLAESARKQIQIQSAYSTALGISIDKLRASSKSVMDGNYNVAATLAKFPEAYNALSAFATASSATLGEEGNALTTAMMNAAVGIGAFTDDSSRAMSGLGGIAPDLLNLMNQMNRDAQSGMLMTAEQGEAYSKKLNASLNKIDVDNLVALAMAGGDYGKMAEVVLLAKSNLLAAEKKQKTIDELIASLRVNDLRKSVVTFENVMMLLSGQFASFKNKFLDSLLPLLASIANVVSDPKTIEAFGTGMAKISDAVVNLVKTFFGLTLDAGKSGDALSKLPAMITGLAGSISSTIDQFSKWLNQFKGKDGTVDWKGMLMEGAKNVIVESAKLLASALWEAAKEILTSPTGWMIIGGLIAASIAKATVGAALTSVGTAIAGKLPGMGGIAGGAGASGAAGAAGGVGGMASFAKAAGGAVQMLALGGAVLMFAKALQMIDGLSSGMESMKILAAGIAAIGAVTFALGISAPVGWAGVGVIVALGAAFVAMGYSLKLATPLVEAIGSVISQQGKAVSMVVATLGLAVAKTIETVTKGIVAVKNAFSQADTTKMQARVDAVKQLSNIPNSNINQTAQAISNLASAMARFGGASGEGEWSVFGADFDDATKERIDAFNMFSQLDHIGINRSAGAISRLTTALLGFANLDNGAIRAVSSAVEVMAKTNDKATAVYDRFGRLDATSIDKASLAVFNMNAANRGHIVAPTPNSNGNFLSNMAKSVAGIVDQSDSKEKGTTGSTLRGPAEAKGANRMEELMVKLVNNTYVAAKQLKEINIKTE